MLEFSFETLGFHSVFAIVNAKNEASERVLQRNHFKKEAHFIENMCYNGKFVDTVFYSILKRNFVKKDN